MFINDGYLFLIFDISTEQCNIYKDFRTKLIKRGYKMVQYSFYKKYIRELKLVDYEIQAIKQIAPQGNKILMLKMTSAQVKSFVVPISGEGVDVEYDRRRVVVY